MTCVWRFGDGTWTSNVTVVSHAYASAGTYSVVLEAINLSGSVSATATVQIVSMTDATQYVANNGNDAAAGTNWVTAKRTIQAGVAAVTTAGGLVLVSNGVYATGGALAAGMMNRVAITNVVTVRSLNGPGVTIIKGQGPMGDMRCTYVTDGALLVGFTLTNGFGHLGGGIYCDSVEGIVSNCTLTGSSASWGGGGAAGGTLYNCTLTGNSAGWGGGAYNVTLNNCTLTDNSAGSGGGAHNGMLYNCTLTGNHAYSGGGADASTLHNCTLTGNSAGSAGSGGGVLDCTLYNCTLTDNSAGYYGGGGASGGTLYNCIIYYNTGLNGANYSGCTLNYCCTLPMPSSGSGNFTNAPRLTGLTNPHLTQGSPCIDAGHNAYVFTATDLDGEARTNGTAVDAGCDEFWAGSCTGALRVAILTPAGTNAVVGYPLSFQADIEGRPVTYVWRFGDGVSASNQFSVSHAYASAGTYSVVLEATNLNGAMSATVTVTIVSIPEATRYVAANGNDAADGTSWATSKATIQAAITIAGGLVLVSNGVYATGGSFAAGLTNRVAIANAVIVRSVNGPNVTIIQGQGPMGSDAVRCAYVADGAALVGFTLRNGFTQTDGSGGGIYCDSTAGMVSNCILTGNSSGVGGGAYGGTLYNCTLTNNSASESGGGV